MSKTIKALCALGLLVTVSACGGNKAPDDEYVVVDTAPISVEPTYTGKYK
ncbi:MAG: hypothetical protein P8O11_01280 [Lentibacter sp.]|nr:hypothetical protein [Lentibacter sp.]MDG1288340.1 hypothetical protein [Lentibacter sp.]